MHYKFKTLGKLVFVSFRGFLWPNWNLKMPRTPHHPAPAVVCRMAFFAANEVSATCCGYFAVCFGRCFHDAAIVGRFDDFCAQKYFAEGRRTAKFDVEIRGDRTRRFVQTVTFHQMICRRPIRMTIEQRADDAAIQHVGERFVVFFRDEFGIDFIPFDSTLAA